MLEDTWDKQGLPLWSAGSSSVLLNVVILIVISLKWRPKQIKNDLEGALPESGYSSTRFLVKSDLVFQEK